MPRNRRFRWGFQTGKIVSGGLMMLGGSVWLVLGLAMGRIFILPIILVVAGLFILGAGLIGRGRVVTAKQMRFQNRVAFITGGAKGIGAGCARVFCGEGARVAIADIDGAAGGELAGDLSAKSSGEAEFFRCDARQAKQIQAAIDKCAARFGRLDCLINNVGVHPPAMTLEETSLEAMESLFEFRIFLTLFSHITQASRSNSGDSGRNPGASIIRRCPFTADSQG